jgi:hypothetical protein
MLGRTSIVPAPRACYRDVVPGMRCCLLLNSDTSSKGESTVSLTYHHYGASFINAPIDQLRRDIQAMLDMPTNLAHAAASAAPGALADAIECPDATHMLTYRSTTCAPGIAEYVVTCSLQCVADAPAATFVEWMRAYRPAAAAGQEQIRTFARALVARDQAVANRLTTEYDGAEVMYMDYTLGGAGAL